MSNVLDLYEQEKELLRDGMESNNVVDPDEVELVMDMAYRGLVGYVAMPDSSVDYIVSEKGKKYYSEKYASKVD